MYQTDFLLKNYQIERVPVESIELLKGRSQDYLFLIEIDRHGGTYCLRLGVERDFGIIDSDEMKEFIEEVLEGYSAKTVTYGPKSEASFFEVIGDLPNEQAAFERLIQGLLQDISTKLKDLSLIETDFMGALVEETVAVYLYNQSYYLLTNRNAQKIFKRRRKYEAEPTAQQSATRTALLMAMLGIVLGCFLVLIRWGFVLYLKWHMVLPSLFAAVFAFRFYRKSKGPVAKAPYMKLSMAISGLLLVFNYIYFTFSMGSSEYFFQFLIRLPLILQSYDLTAEFFVRYIIGLSLFFVYGLCHYLFHKRGQRVTRIKKIE